MAAKENVCERIITMDCGWTLEFTNEFIWPLREEVAKGQLEARLETMSKTVFQKKNNWWLFRLLCIKY